MRSVILMALMLGACAKPDPASIKYEEGTKITLFGIEESTALPEVAALDATGKPIPGARITWTVDPPTVATITPEGNVQALADGTATLTAHAGQALANIPLTVSTADTLKISGLPSTGEVTVGKPYAIDVRAWADGRPVKAPPVTWSLSDGSLAKVEAEHFQATAPGKIVVTARSGGLEVSREMTAVE
ncbi:MAG: Ig-like domain-containing protein [Pseudomonadota bacterium]